MAQSRASQISLDDTPYYHCICRCVRRAFLCGRDHYSGQDYEHRRQWVVDRLALLVEVFAVDLCAYAVMSNHYHLVLKIDRHRALSWSSEEVAERWMRLFSGHPLVTRWQADVADTEIQDTHELDTYSDPVNKLTFSLAGSGYGGNSISKECCHDPVSSIPDFPGRYVVLPLHLPLFPARLSMGSLVRLQVFAASTGRCWVSGQRFACALG